MWHQLLAQLAEDAGFEEIFIDSTLNPGASARFDRRQYSNRNLIERFFCRIKQFRRIATRYDKLAARFSSFIALCAAIIGAA